MLMWAVVSKIRVWAKASKSIRPHTMHELRIIILPSGCVAALGQMSLQQERLSMPNVD